MGRLTQSLIFIFLRFILWFRYRITYKGLENLTKENLSNPGGVLFLPNHPAVFVDPVSVSLGVWKKFPIRPLIIEYLYYTPIVHPLMKMVGALPVPNFEITSNSLKKGRNEKIIDEVSKNLKSGDNFLLYPAGQLKDYNKELIGGASGAYRIYQKTPEANIVLVRVKGLYGSIFSRYYEGKTPKLFPTILKGIKFALTNLIFFSPRREITVEFYPKPEDFPSRDVSRLDFNHYLENWYNQPDGLTHQEGEHPGDSTVLVSYSIWKDKFLEKTFEPKPIEDFDIKNVPDEVKNKVIKKLCEMTKKQPSEIKPDMNLATDVGLDSLDTAELSAFLHDYFDIARVPVMELTTVGRMMGIAAKQIKWEEKIEEAPVDLDKWNAKRPHQRLTLADGDTLAEVFLNNCNRHKKIYACADDGSGALTYSDLKLRAILLADYIKDLPGQYIGVLLPSTVAAYLIILACEIAGKTPLPINWTIGPKHLQSVSELSKVEVVLSSWVFLDRLDNVDLGAIEDKIIMLEDVRRELTLSKKIKAAYRSKLSSKSILKTFGSDKVKPEDTAVLLFTSGTESLPKGVPLSHKNILSNLEGGFAALELFQDDVIYGILPPFHSFGFNISGLAGLLSGMRVAFFPNPNDGPNLARGVEKWKITVFCGAPTFVKKMLKSAETKQLESIRLTVCGAEKTPPEIFKLLENHGKKDTYGEGYGITECSPILTTHHTGHPIIGVGQAIPNVDLLVVNEETNEPVPTGQRGMILASGPNIFSGYINPGISSPFLTIEGKTWYKTGDLGFLDEEGYLTISGRLKRFIKIGGEMISLPAIEETLVQLATEKGWKAPKSEDGQENDGPVIAVSAKEHGDEKAEIVLFTLFDVSLDELNEYLRNSGFSNLAKVSSVIKVKEVPILGSGKTNYRHLEGTYLN
ncbi:MAG: AMP-binding protein [Chlamydiota bacterium]|nr:AMP-binding protein [Chlamydiota bacterium]